MASPFASGSRSLRIVLGRRCECTLARGQRHGQASFGTVARLASRSRSANGHLNTSCGTRRGMASLQQEEARGKQAIGPFNIRAAALFVVTAGGLFWYFTNEKKAVEERKREEEAQKRVGRPRIGGPFELVMPTQITSVGQAKTVRGLPFTDEDLKGSFTLLYFGFTNCPDICPEELDKMSQIVDTIDKKYGQCINPVFITCDPARDTLAATSLYVSEFHPRMIGLTGAFDEIKATCKTFRVYFSTPPGVDPNSDYLVDHSIFFYLMDPEGKFVDAFGRSVTTEEATEKCAGYIDKWLKAGNTIGHANVKERKLQEAAEGSL